MVNFNKLYLNCMYGWMYITLVIVFLFLNILVFGLFINGIGDLNFEIIITVSKVTVILGFVLVWMLVIQFVFNIEDEGSSL